MKVETKATLFSFLFKPFATSLHHSLFLFSHAAAAPPPAPVAHPATSAAASALDAATMAGDEELRPSSLPSAAISFRPPSRSFLRCRGAEEGTEETGAATAASPPFLGAGEEEEDGEGTPPVATMFAMSSADALAKSSEPETAGAFAANAAAAASSCFEYFPCIVDSTTVQPKETAAT